MISNSILNPISDTTEKPPYSNNFLFYPDQITSGIANFREQVNVVEDAAGNIGVAIGSSGANTHSNRVLATLPPLYPEWLGDRSFQETHRLRFPYVGGAMANGITTTRMVIVLAKAGMLGFFGAAGLPAEKVEFAIDELQATLGPLGLPWGSNLIHSPVEPMLEERVADLYIKKGVRRVSASAYMQLSSSVVRYACTGLHRDSEGCIQRTNFLFAKISRPETAELFMSPAPKKILDELASKGFLTHEEVLLAQQVPLAEDITVEADSGGHTDRQALSAIFPTIALLRDRLVRKFKYAKPIRLGAAGGLGTPNSVAAAFSMGAAYVLTGTVNQACVESGLHQSGRENLARARTGDVGMTPASDMFEMGVKLQVLKKGTMYPSRAAKLYDLYTRYASLDHLSEATQAQLEKEIFKAPLNQVWAETKDFWSKRDPGQIDKAERDSKHKMALVFRSYLGLSSRWAIIGDKERVLDFQIWCGPAIASFNQWTEDSFLSDYQNRTVVQVALNLLEGAAACVRAFQLRTYGVPVSSDAFDYRPRPLTISQ